MTFGHKYWVGARRRLGTGTQFEWLRTGEGPPRSSTLWATDFPHQGCVAMQFLLSGKLFDSICDEPIGHEGCEAPIQEN